MLYLKIEGKWFVHTANICGIYLMWLDTGKGLHRKRRHYTYLSELNIIEETSINKNVC